MGQPFGGVNCFSDAFLKQLQEADGARSTSQIAGALGVSRTTALRKANALVRQGVLKRTSTKGRSVRYVLALG